jgi:hypothetical protein
VLLPHLRLLKKSASALDDLFEQPEILLFNLSCLFHPHLIQILRLMTRSPWRV